MSLNVFGDTPTLETFDEPERSSDFNIKQHDGRVLILQVAGVVQQQTKDYGVKDAVSCPKVVSIDAATNEAQEFTDVLIFQTAPVSQLRDKAGSTQVAQVVLYKSKSGPMAAKLDKPTEAQVKAAQAYAASA